MDKWDRILRPDNVVVGLRSRRKFDALRELTAVFENDDAVTDPKSFLSKLRVFAFFKIPYREPILVFSVYVFVKERGSTRLRSSPMVQGAFSAGVFCFGFPVQKCLV